MAKIIVLSDCRVPTIPEGGHGLGRLAYDVATQLKLRGHNVTLWAGIGSSWEGELVIHDNEQTRAREAKLEPDTIYIDLSHYHQLSLYNPDNHILDWIVDGECGRQPKRALVNTRYDLGYYPDATVIPIGVDIDNIPFFSEPQEPLYLAYAAKIHIAKGYQDALRVNEAQDLPVKFVGERHVNDKLPDWRDTLTGQEFFNFVGGALGLLHPVKAKYQLGGGRMPLEAAAMGTPVIVYDYASTRDHVEHCVSGFIVRDTQEMIDATQDLVYLDRAAARAWVADTHNFEVMCKAIEAEF